MGFGYFDAQIQNHGYNIFIEAKARERVCMEQVNIKLEAQTGLVIGIPSWLTHDDYYYMSCLGLMDRIVGFHDLKH